MIRVWPKRIKCTRGEWFLGGEMGIDRGAGNMKAPRENGDCGMAQMHKWDERGVNLRVRNGN